MDLYLTVLCFQNVFIFNEASKFYHHVLKARLYKFDNFLFNFLKIDNLLDGLRHHLELSFMEMFFGKNPKSSVEWIFLSVDRAVKKVCSAASKEILILAML